MISQEQSERLSEQHFKRFNDAADHFRKVMQRWDDRLTFEGSSYWEQYLRGRMALILDCEVARNFEFDSARRLGEDRAKRNLCLFVVLKADIKNPHKLNHWDDKLMFIQDVEVVKCPNGPIPSLKGFYDIGYKVCDGVSDLLFQSAFHYLYKHMLGLDNWKLCVLGNFTTSVEDGLPEKHVEGASQIMNGISHDLGCATPRKSTFIDPNVEFILPEVFLHTERIEVRPNKLFHQMLKVKDVLIGPFNL